MKITIKKNTISLTTEYGSYKDLYLHRCRYPNGNLAIELKSGLYGTVMIPTVNPDIRLDDTMVCIKDWSENEGIASAMENAGLLGKQLRVVACGYCLAKVYEVTDRLRNMLNA